MLAGLDHDERRRAQQRHATDGEHPSTVATSLGQIKASAFQFRPYHGTKLYNEITTNEQHLIYSNGNELTSTKKQYNFSSGNYSHVSDAVLARSIHTIIA